MCSQIGLLRESLVTMFAAFFMPPGVSSQTTLLRKARGALLALEGAFSVVRSFVSIQRARVRESLITIFAC